MNAAASSEAEAAAAEAPTGETQCEEFWLAAVHKRRIYGESWFGSIQAAVWCVVGD